MSAGQVSGDLHSQEDWRLRGATDAMQSHTCERLRAWFLLIVKRHEEPMRQQNINFGGLCAKQSF